MDFLRTAATTVKYAWLMNARTDGPAKAGSIRSTIMLIHAKSMPLYLRNFEFDLQLFFGNIFTLRCRCTRALADARSDDFKLQSKFIYRSAYLQFRFRPVFAQFFGEQSTDECASVAVSLLDYIKRLSW